MGPKKIRRIKARGIWEKYAIWSVNRSTKRWMEKTAQCIILKIVLITTYYEGNCKEKIEMGRTFLMETWNYDNNGNWEDSIGKIPLENPLCDKKCLGDNFKKQLKGIVQRYMEMNLFNGMVLIAVTPLSSKKLTFVELTHKNQHIIGKLE